MKALVFNGIGKVAAEHRPQPKVQDPSDASIELLRTTICGSDLHLIRGHGPTVDKGRVISHTEIDIVERAGKHIQNSKVGDHVLVSCITSCATCSFCKKGKSGLCNSTGGWRLRHTEDGTQGD